MKSDLWLDVQIVLAGIRNPSLCYGATAAIAVPAVTSLVGGAMQTGSNQSIANSANNTQMQMQQQAENFDAQQQTNAQDFDAQMQTNQFGFNAAQQSNAQQFDVQSQGAQYADNLQLQRNAQAFDASQVQQAEQYNTIMSNTAYQRAQADMKAAGLNPILAAGAPEQTIGAPTASSPGGSVSAPSSPMAAGSSPSSPAVGIGAPHAAMQAPAHNILGAAADAAMAGISTAKHADEVDADIKDVQSRIFQRAWDNTLTGKKYDTQDAMTRNIDADTDYKSAQTLNAARSGAILDLNRHTAFQAAQDADRQTAFQNSWVGNWLDYAGRGGKAINPFLSGSSSAKSLFLE